MSAVPPRRVLPPPGTDAALPSIRRRLSRVMLGVALAWSLLVSVVIWAVVRHEVDELMDNTLQESAEIMLGLLSYETPRLPLAGGGAMPAPPHEEHVVWQLVGADGQLLLRSHRAPAKPFSAAARDGFFSLGDEWRVFGLPFETRPGARFYAAHLGQERHEARVEASLLTAAAAVLVGIGCALWLRRMAGRELAPIAALSAAIGRHDPEYPRSRLPAPQREELVPMHHAIEDLATRLAARVASERAFAAHAAHALRTPLAGMVMQLAVAQRKATPEVQPHLRRTREAADRLRGVVSALLTLFRANTELDWQAVDVGDLVAHLPLEALSVSVDGEVHCQADPDLLVAALLNLLDNAQRLGARLVTVRIEAAAEGPRITLVDDGPGFERARIAEINDALERQAYDGTMGLGLMLADLIARAHGGRLRVSNDEGGGASIVLQLATPVLPVGEATQPVPFDDAVHGPMA